ncbi:MAG: chromosomal replication initiator protein DnaA, partial [Alphaproteobacteria bacterium]|nr:chromosomal replication initiator protein DnaA [Alphaproteobacteria bacterium]
GDNVYYNWLHDIELDYVSNGQVMLKAPSRFIREWVLNNYLQPIKNIWAKVNPAVIWVNIYCDERGNNEPQQQEPSYGVVSPNRQSFGSFSNAEQVNSRDARDQVSQYNTTNNYNTNTVYSENTSYDSSIHETDITNPNNDYASQLDPRFTFENFVVGDSNEFAFKASKRVAQSHVTALEFNPLFLYGPVGHGKTHLMHAIAWEISRNFPNQKICYLSAEKFMFQFVKSLKNKDMISFKEQFRSVDIMLIDDLQFICGKESTQAEFFHTFNALVDANKKIVLACDRSPNDLDSIDVRFKSRLGSGLVADIHYSNYELRKNVIARKADMLGVKVDNNLTEMLAERISSNIRELEGAMNKLVAYSTLMEKPINLDMANIVLKDLFRTSAKAVSIELIQEKIAAYYKIKVTDILSSSRERKLARPRQLAMFLCKKHAQASLIDIGRKFGGRDHTTVMHALKQIENLLATDNDLMNDLSLVERTILG